MIQTFHIANGVSLHVLRLDIKHPVIQGNKYYKLKHNLEAAKKQNCHTLITFGGAYSNHIHATAMATKASAFRTIGMIRGEESKDDNPTLRDAKNNGMELHYIDRETYRNLRLCGYDKKAIKQKIDLKLPEHFYVIPEGGTNDLAVKGAMEILEDVPSKLYDMVCIPVGTGGTISGVINSLDGNKKVIGFQSLKGDFLKHEIKPYLKSEFSNWELNQDYHFGGFGRISDDLISFINQFKKDYGIPTEPLYTGKMFFGIMDMVMRQKIPAGTKILAIHTGGLQGIRGMNERYGNLINT